MQGMQDVFFANLNVVCNMGGYFKPDADTPWSCAPHYFSQNKFYFITKGRCRIWLQGEQQVASAGDWFWIPANMEHGYERFLGEPFEKYWVHFDLYPGVDFFQSMQLPTVVKVGTKGNAYRLFDRFMKVFESNKFCDKLHEKALLLMLVADYMSLAFPEGVDLQSTHDERIDDVIRFIHSNLQKPLSVETLADQCHLHPNHFMRYFKNKTGQTPARYVKMKKMEAAKRYLEDTDLYIGEIMERIGETNVSNFSKQFKSLYEFSPRDYRKFFQKSKQV